MGPGTALRARPATRAVGLLLPTLLLSGLFVLAPGDGAGQQSRTLRLVGPDDQTRSVGIAGHRGYDAVPASVLTGLGWAVDSEAGAWRIAHRGGPAIRLVEGSPYFYWSGRLLQMVHAPYLFGEDLYVPIQLLLDVFPARLSRVYRLESAPGDRSVLRVDDPGHWSGAAVEPSAPMERPADERIVRKPEAPPERPRADMSRVVVIDPGHGGRDPGATGPGGTREKDVALALGRALARELEGRDGLEVHLTRDSDVLVPLWQRGERATDIKGDRPGLFISLHANALPGRRSVRGFETYFLSEARTEHERRVAANENAPLALDGGEGLGDDPDLTFILKELRNLDHQHWSALFAERVHEHLAPVHPGPNRGVKQGPFAVITNALMPAVLVEVGFITNPVEERLLMRDDFHRDVARALARSVVDFFERYPPGQSSP